MNNNNNKKESEPYGENKIKDCVVTRPSSPRKFFERLYGNLDSKNTNSSEKDLSLPSSPNSSNNSVEGVHEDTSHAFSLYHTTGIRKDHGFPSHFESLRDIIGLSGETPVFPPGLAAFRKYF